MPDKISRNAWREKSSLSVTNGSSINNVNKKRMSRIADSELFSSSKGLLKMPTNENAMDEKIIYKIPEIFIC